MDIEIFFDYEALSERLADEILSYMFDPSGNLICLPSGDTPRRAYQILSVALSQRKGRPLTCTLIGLDEWVGMGKNTRGSCQYIMHEWLYKPASIRGEQIIEFNARSPDLTGECKKMDRFIAEYGPIDLAVLGIGINGHLGLNEPGTSFSQTSHVVNLTKTTKRTAQKYFPEKVVLEKGITLGLKHFLEARRLILIASGKQKAEVIKRIVREDVSEQIPATIAKIHRNSTLLIDQDAASEL
jgi:glucosamine-6-phosphate isomerase